LSGFDKSTVMRLIVSKSTHYPSNKKLGNSTGIPNCIPFLQKEWYILIHSGSLVGK